MNLELFALALDVLPNDGRKQAAVPEPAFEPFDLTCLSNPAAESGSSEFGTPSGVGQSSPELVTA